MKCGQFMFATSIAYMCFLTVAFGATAATVTNRWVGASGGDWGVDANWSLGHVPKADELAYFDFSGQAMEISVNDEYTVGTWYVAKASKSAPLTFKGTGKIVHGGYSPSPYIQNNHPFTLDGVTFDIGSFHSLWYSPVTLKNGGTFISGDYVYLWNSTANLTVNGGSFRGGKLLWDANVSVTIENGDVFCTDLDMRDVKDDNGDKKYYSLKMSINEGGSFSCSKAFNLYRTSSLTVNGGSITTEGSFNVEPEVDLNLISGAITNSAALNDKRFILENKGVAVCIKNSSNKAVFFDDVTDGDVLVFNAPFHVPNGYFSTTNSLTLVSSHPFQVERFYYLSGSTAKALFTLKLDQLVVGKGCIMDSGDGDARTYKIEGPTVWRPTVEAMNPNTSRTVYPQLDGELVIDTRDWIDPEQSRKLAIRNLGSDNGNGALVIRGGGGFSMTHLYSYFPYRYVTVEDGSTLELQPFANSEFSPLNAMKITLGANATLKIPGGTNCVAASDWIIDPSARIVVDIPAGTPAGGLAVLRDYSGKLADCSSQVVLTGDGAEGWTTHFAEGTLSLVKSVGEVDGEYTYEWTGGAGTRKWADGLNWYGQAAPEKEDKTSICVFGASASAEAITEIDFNISGSYLGQLHFRNSAIKPFAVTSTGERTFFLDGANNSSASIYSASAVPQYVKLRFRRTGAGNRFSFVAGSGPIMIDAPVTYCAENCKLSACGDIRVVSDLKWPQLSLSSLISKSSPGTRLTVLPGATVTITNQITGFGGGSTSFNVQKGGRIEFLAGDGRFYRWTAKGGKHIIDGTMSVAIPCQGGRDQAYGGEGTLSLSSVAPYSAASAIVLQDSLTLELASDWITVAPDVDFPLTLKVASFSSPTLKVDSNWKYGPASGASVQTQPTERALNIGRSAVFTVDANGHIAEFVDPVAGDGTLSITNGTLKLPGAVSEGVTVRLEDGGALLVCGNLAVGGLEAAGGVLRYDAGGILDCPEIDDLSKLEFEFSGGVPTGWTTVLVSTNPINGNVTTSGVESRVVAVDGVYQLQCRKDIGFHFIVR